MIAFLHGSIIDRHEEGLVLNVAGVGYDLNCSFTTMQDFSDTTDARFWVHTAVREDAITLFGFSTALEKRVFLSLLKVNGVGPKMAMKILSGARLESLVEMIETANVGALSKLPKVGKKTAEQLILSLKGKLVLSEEASSSQKKQSAAQPTFRGVRSEVMSALVNLGFRLQDAEKVVSELPEDVDLQNGLRTSLQALSGGF
ncbi:MAG: Holliday junction branch migration protein RuvA [Bdellovibrionota bacterium]